MRSAAFQVGELRAVIRDKIDERNAGRWQATIALLGVVFLSFTAAGAPGKAAASPESAFAVLETHCVKCHGGEKSKGGLDLVTRAALLRGGESGAAVVPGKPDVSRLVKMIRHELDPGMPHKERKLPDEAIAQLVAWVKAGVPYRRPLNKTAASTTAKTSTKFTITETDRRHWAFQTVKRPMPPTVRRSPSLIRHPIDQFILAKLEAAGLSFSPSTNPEILMRRITLDLVGLPPTPAEMAAFVQSASRDPQAALEALVDKLLASPHYGERWGRHWLDLARFAETDGFEHDAVRPHSWRYRDYVIKSFNDDKPYDQFIREQVAGDELFANAKPERQNPEVLVATGFNLLGPDMVDSADQVQRRHNTLNDMTDTTALAFLGLTLGCARCHDHKFEPLSQRDYYALQAFFTPAKFQREQPIPTLAERAVFDAAAQQFNEHPKIHALAELEAPARERLRRQKLAKFSSEAQAAHQTPPAQRTTEQANLVLETAALLEISEKELAGAFDDDAKARRQDLLDELKQLPKPRPLPQALALASNPGPAAKTFVLFRGEYGQPGEEVGTGFPAVLKVARASSSHLTLDANSPTHSATPKDSTTPPDAGWKPALLSRAALADWIASPANPLTARVMVNRIWQHHFGRGLVATPSDFGTHGQAPTHPELLDWLASEFVARGWSVKQMHKLMLLSATYQQTSVAADVGRLTSAQTPDARPQTQSIDPDNKLYWRMNRLRLEGEVIRDSLLAISGQLNPAMGGPGVFPPVPREIIRSSMGGWPQNDRVSDYSRRSIYIFARRNLRFPFLEVFDAPDNNLSCPARGQSTTAPQSLTLLNAEEVTTAAKLTAARLKQESTSVEEQITLAYRLTLGRAPAAKEMSLAREFLAQSPLNEFCRALFNLNDFVYLE